MVGPMEPIPDEELVARYQARTGSAEAEQYLDQLFQRYRGRVALWCLRLSNDREGAADLAQEVLLRAFRALGTFRAEAKFSTWLYTIARNHCFNQIKSRATSTETSSDELIVELPDQSPDPLAQLERQSVAHTLRELMRSSLTTLETRVLTLHYVEELPLDAVTRMLNLENTSGAKSYIVSARRKLARAAEQWKAREPGARS
jgi:RNA polymerase sigma-70 factor (ECF subfamily)